MSFGNQMKLLREEKGMLQKELAALINVSNGTVSNYEKSVHFPDEKTLCKIADIFDVSVDYLLGRSLCRKMPVNQDKILVNIINEISANLSDEQVEEVANFVDFLKSKSV